MYLIDVHNNRIPIDDRNILYVHTSNVGHSFAKIY